MCILYSVKLPEFLFSEDVLFYHFLSFHTTNHLILFVYLWLHKIKELQRIFLLTSYIYFPKIIMLILQLFLTKNTTCPCYLIHLLCCSFYFQHVNLFLHCSFLLHQTIFHFLIQVYISI